MVSTSDRHGAFQATANADSFFAQKSANGTKPVPFNAELAHLFMGPSHGATPDDSDVQTSVPSVQVDYLSHEWAEEDIWTSWRATTKQKASLVNGIRLENSIWRQWIKKRFQLKTISPETLNWLKDSDVTWLYGPLHTGNRDLTEYTPKEAKTEDRLGLDSQVKARSGLKMNSTRMPKKAVTTCKPILKHRSLSDILTVPNLKDLRRDSDETSASDGESIPHSERVKEAASTHIALGPSLKHAISQDESDTNAESDENRHKRRKHIAFNNRVEQCIAVDSDSDRDRYNSQSSSGSSSAQGFRGSRLERTPARKNSYFKSSDSEEEEEDSEDSDTSDADEEVLTFRTSRSHSSSSYGFSNHAKWGRNPGNIEESHPSSIAKLAPTYLKNSEVYPGPSPVVVYSPQSRPMALPSDSEDSNGPHTPTADDVPVYHLPYSAAPAVFNSSTATDLPFSDQQHEYASSAPGQSSMYASPDDLPLGHHTAQAQKAPVTPKPVLKNAAYVPKNALRPPPDRSSFLTGEHSPIFSPPPAEEQEEEPILERKAIPIPQSRIKEEEEHRGRGIARSPSVEIREASRGASVTSSHGSLSPGEIPPTRRNFRKSGNRDTPPSSSSSLDDI